MTLLKLVLDYYFEANIGHNLALWKPTKQSYMADFQHRSSRAVDGNATTNGDLFTRIGSSVGSWWQVDLEAVYEIHTVVITSK